MYNLGTSADAEFDEELYVSDPFFTREEQAELRGRVADIEAGRNIVHFDPLKDKREPFDYTEWQKNLYNDVSLEELCEKANNFWNETHQDARAINV